MAITILETEVAAELGVEVEKIARLFPACSDLINEYSRASAIPSNVQNEALVRLVGFMISTAKTHSGIKSQRVDDLQVEYFSNHKVAMKNSGAESLLSRFKQRRAC